MASEISRRQLGIAAGAFAAGGVVGGVAAGSVACGSRDATPTAPATTPSVTEVSAQSLGYTLNVNKPGGGPGYVFFVSGTTAANPGAGSRGALLVVVDRSARWSGNAPFQLVRPPVICPTT